VRACALACGRVYRAGRMAHIAAGVRFRARVLAGRGCAGRGVGYIAIHGVAGEAWRGHCGAGRGIVAHGMQRVRGRTVLLVRLLLSASRVVLEC
jgi:hypothetical protein